MKEKNILYKIISIVGVFIIIMFTATIIKTREPSTLTTAKPVQLSNNKIEWGLKRNNNHNQPDLGATNKKLIDEYRGIAIGSKEKPYIYLTFDNGYEAGYTSKILDTLKANEVKATFFITGHYLNSQPELTKRMIDDGHSVGNHTINHYSLPEISDEKIKDEVMNLHRAVYEKFNYEMKYFRPPKGEYSERTLALTNELGYTTVMWSFAYDDWDENKQDRENYGKDKILSNIHSGEVMLLHANSKDNANILDYVIKEIKKQGYEFKNLDEFVR